MYKCVQYFYDYNKPICSGQSLSHVQLFATPWTATLQASLSITNSWSLLRLVSIESVMPSNYLILCCPLRLLPSIFPSIRVFSNESVLCIRWPEYWGFSFSISPSSEYLGLISFRIYWNLSQETKIPQLCSLTEGESMFLAFDLVYKLKVIFLYVKVTIHFGIRKYVKSYSFSNVICLWSPLWKSLLQHLSLVHWLKTEYTGCVLESAILYVYYRTSVFP